MELERKEQLYMNAIGFFNEGKVHIQYHAVSWNVDCGFRHGNVELDYARS